jgi:hypothetical protein
MAEQEETAAAEETVAGLSLQDLASMVQVIDLCSQRGAFQGSELEAVGALRGRIQSFVAANTPAEEESTEDQETTTDE